MNIRAISLWQPWASAVVIGSKRIETRHWSTDYRGPLAIHAAKRCNKNELIYYVCCWNWVGALWSCGVRMGNSQPLWEALPFGAIVGVVDLVDCRPSETFTVGELDTPRRPEGEKGHCYDWTERQMGNFAPGRYGWVLENPRLLKNPVPYKGSQGFFNIDARLVEA